MALTQDGSRSQIRLAHLDPAQRRSLEVQNNPCCASMLCSPTMSKRFPSVTLWITSGKRYARTLILSSSVVMSRSAVRVRSSALLSTRKTRENGKPPTRASGALSAVDSSSRPRPCPRRRAFPCWVSSASSGQGSWLCWLVPEGAGPIPGERSVQGAR